MENLENNKTTTLTIVDNNVTDIEIEPCLFILFVEYLGYVSPFITWAEECCNNVEVPKFKYDILFVESQSFLSKILKEYSIKEIHSLYDKFNCLAIEKWREKYKLNHHGEV